MAHRRWVWRRAVLAALLLGIASCTPKASKSVPPSRPTTVPRSPTASPSLPPRGRLFLPPVFAETTGWHARSSDPAPKGQPTVAWASTTPFDSRDLPMRTAFPWQTIAHLPPTGIVESVEVVPSSFPPTKPWPRGSWKSPDLRRATVRTPEGEEPIRPITVYEIDGPYALTRVYFGTTSPSNLMIRRAQRELDRLVLPPSCPEPGTDGASPGWARRRSS